MGFGNLPDQPVGAEDSQLSAYRGRTAAFLLQREGELDRPVRTRSMRSWRRRTDISRRVRPPRAGREESRTRRNGIYLESLASGSGSLPSRTKVSNFGCAVAPLVGARGGSRAAVGLGGTPVPIPPAIVTYCLPSSSYVMGGPMPPRRPVSMSRSFSPLSALYATRRPSLIAWKTRFPAVVTVPPPVAPPPGWIHRRVCVTGSHAISAPPLIPSGSSGPMAGGGGSVLGPIVTPLFFCPGWYS